MKKEIKIVAIVLAAVLVFLVGFGLGTTKGISVEINVKNEGVAAQTPNNSGNNVQVQGPANNGGAAQTPDNNGGAAQTPDNNGGAAQTPDNNGGAAQTPDNNGGAAQTPDNNGGAAQTPDNNGGSATSKVPSTPAECVKAYNDAINNAKAYTGTVNVYKYSTVNLKCTSCSVSFLTSVVNAALPKLATPTEWTRTYANGVHTEGDGKLGGVIAPTDKEKCELTEADVVSATATANGDGYTVKLVIKAETSVYDGTNTTYPVSHDKAMTPLNLATLTLPIDGASITSANMSYPGATCELKIDGQGRLTEQKIVLPMSGTGAGGIGKVGVEVGIEGTMDDLLQFTY